MWAVISKVAAQYQVKSRESVNTVSNKVLNENKKIETEFCRNLFWQLCQIAILGVKMIKMTGEIINRKPVLYLSWVLTASVKALSKDEILLLFFSSENSRGK